MTMNDGRAAVERDGETCLARPNVDAPVCDHKQDW